MKVKLDKQALMRFRANVNEATNIIQRLNDDLAELDTELKEALNNLSEAIIIDDVEEVKGDLETN